jgi:hypothetical protein
MCRTRASGWMGISIVGPSRIPSVRCLLDIPLWEPRAVIDVLEGISFFSFSLIIFEAFEISRFFFEPVTSALVLLVLV